MKRIDRTAIETLLAAQGRPCVSMFFPAHPGGNGQGDDSVRLRNLLRQAKNLLLEHGVLETAASQMLEPVSKLPDQGKDWNERGNGVAIFVAPGIFHAWRLPAPASEGVTVGGRFNLKPLVGQVLDETPWYLLRLTDKDVTLFRVGADELQKMDVPGLPESMDEALNYHSVDRGQQTHSAMSTPGSYGRRKQGAVFHGQGGIGDTSDDDHKAFCRQVDKAVSSFLRGRTAPLVLACVKEMEAIYREVNTHNDLVDSYVPGSLAAKSDFELHQLASRVIHDLQKQQIGDFATVYRENAETGRSSHDIETIVPAAREGRIRLLFVDPHATMYGRFHSETGKLEVTNRKNDDDLVNLAIAETLGRGGTVFNMNEANLPANSPVAAVFRY